MIIRLVLDLPSKGSCMKAKPRTVSGILRLSLSSFRLGGHVRNPLGYVLAIDLCDDDIKIWNFVMLDVEVPEEVNKATFHFGVLARLDEGKIVLDSRIGLWHFSEFFPRPSPDHWKVCGVSLG